MQFQYEHLHPVFLFLDYSERAWLGMRRGNDGLYKWDDESQVTDAEWREFGVEGYHQSCLRLKKGANTPLVFTDCSIQRKFFCSIPNGR